MKRKGLLFYSVTALGISSIITQLVVMREFLTVLYGNELVLGVILANWLLLTGVGAYLGRAMERIKDKLSFLVLAQLAIALLPLPTIFLIRSLRTMLFPVGPLVGISQVFTFSLILLLPYCLLAGFLLPFYCQAYSDADDQQEEKTTISKVYFLDNIGDIAADFSLALCSFTCSNRFLSSG